MYMRAIIGCVPVLILAAVLLFSLLSPYPALVDGVTRATAPAHAPVPGAPSAIAYYRDNMDALKTPPMAHTGFYKQSNRVFTNQRDMLNRIARYYGLPHDLLYYQNMIESSGRCVHVPNAAGAMGCFQFLPGTAREFGLITQKGDFRAQFAASADAAARYMLWLALFLYEDDADLSDWRQVRHILAAFNAGHARVKTASGVRIPGYYETVRYVMLIDDLVHKRAEWVRPGDTLSAISARTNVPVSVLLRGNPGITGSHDLIAETVLSLPNEQGLSRFVVKKGMSLYQIAKKTGVSLQSILLINKIENAEYLRVGQVLHLPALICSQHGAEICDKIEENLYSRT